MKILNDRKYRKTIYILASLVAVFLALSFSDNRETRAAGEYYTVVGKTIYVNTQSGDSMAGPKIDSALAYAKDYATATNHMTVKVPEGTYTLKPKTVSLRIYGVDSKKKVDFKGLHIYSNTTLDVTGCTIKMGNNMTNMLVLGNFYAKKETSSKAVPYRGIPNYNFTLYNSGYSGFQNISIIGGVWKGNTSTTNTVMKFYHATNVHLTNVVIQKGGGKHQIEIGGVNKFYMTGCTFEKHMTGQPGSEAVQLDVLCDSAVMHTGYNDGTPNKNVYVNGCTFKNVDIGIGTHTLLEGAYQRNIAFKENTFENIREYAIEALCYENFRAENNTIKNCGNGISVKSFLKLEKKGTSLIAYNTILEGTVRYTAGASYNSNISIKNNSIDVSDESMLGKAIYVAGYNINYTTYSAKAIKMQKNNYYCNGVKIIGNKINASKDGIVCENAKNVVVQKNRIDSKNGCARYGIGLLNNSEITRIENNKLYNMGSIASGIYVNKSKVTGSILSNKVKSTSGFIASCKYGIRITNKASVVGMIKSNKIYSSESHGIYVGKKSSYCYIDSNKINNAGANGIYIVDVKDRVSFIRYNELKSCRGNGIKVKNSKIGCTTAILNNTIKSSKKQKNAIQIQGTKYSVRANRIYKFKTGIRIENRAVGSVVGNKFYNVKTTIKY